MVRVNSGPPSAAWNQLNLLLQCRIKCLPSVSVCVVQVQTVGMLHSEQATVQLRQRTRYLHQLWHILFLSFTRSCDCDLCHLTENGIVSSVLINKCTPNF